MRNRLWILVLGLGLWACQRTTWVKSGTAVSHRTVDSTVAPSAAMEKLVTSYRARLGQSLAETLANNAQELKTGKGENRLGNLVADLTRSEAQRICQCPVDLALVTNGGLRVPLREGPITVGDVYELMPFENELVLVTLPGTALKKLLEAQAQRQMINLAGVRSEIRGETWLSAQVNGQAVDTTRSYVMATSDYLADGGDRLDMLKASFPRQNLEAKYRDVIIGYLRQKGRLKMRLHVELDGRLKQVE